MKKSFQLAVILLITGNSLLFSQSNKNLELNKNFTHVVCFWLKNPDNQQDRNDFETSLLKFLKTSKYAQTKFIGVPAYTPREVVDNSYTYSIILSFPSREIQDLYQKERAHLLFIKEAEHLWKKVVVYDSVGME